MARIFDIIEYVDEGRQEIVNRVPERGSGDFRIGSQLIVRESQAAVFYRDGKALDTFGPGRHTLTTANIPYLVDLIGKAFSSQTPFKAEVYFVTLRELTDMKWGTPNPITIPDPILGMARVTSYGTYAMQVADPQLFVAKIVGTQGLFNTRDIEGFFRSIILTKMTDLIGEMKKSVIQMAAFVEELAAGVRAKAAEEFAARGVTLTSFYIESIAPTEETAKAIDARASMGAIGDMGAYMQYQAAQALRETAQKPGGGTAATGVELGAGLGLGAAMAQMVTQAARPPATGAPAAPAAGGTPAVSANPTTPAEVQALLDSLDLRLANGELSEAVYQRLHDKWEQRLQDMLKTP
ncbi:MAG: SPFH domain-containing protein [Chloroflexi bacterium]|nr:SPFH domain-containing protein [Chloroflexota bacterium]OQA98194.1 MAG: SPFH domain / Band 7 family protein [Chloroflexi bacterium ADurb.Bin222]